MLRKLSLSVVVFLVATAPLFAQNQTTDKVFFIAPTTNHIWADSFQFPSNVWTSLDVTAAISAPAPASTSPLAALAVFEGTGNPDTDHVFFLESNGDIGEEFFNGTLWQYVNDTTSARAPVARSNSSLSVSATGSETGEYDVFYQGTNNHIYDINFFAGSFGVTDVTNALGGQLPAAASGTPISGLPIELFCVDVNGNLDFMKHLSGSWSGKVLGGQPFTPPAGGMTGFTNFQQTEDPDVRFVNSADDMQDFILEGSSWVEITPLGFPARGLPFSTFPSSGPHVGEDSFYIGADSTIDEIHQVKTTFTESKPSVLAGAPSATPSGTPAISAFLNSLGIRVYYSGPDNHIYQIRLVDGGPYFFSDVTALAGGPLFSGAARSQLAAILP